MADAGSERGGATSDRLIEAVRLRENGHLEEARALLLSLVEGSPDNPAVLYQCAWVHDKMGLERDAVPFYEAAIEKGLDGADLHGALLGLGSTYRCLGEYAKAETTLRRGCAAFPESRANEVFLAMALHNLERHDEAMEVLLRNLAETSTDESIARYGRAIAYYAGRLNERSDGEAEKEASDE